jgi:hypothetical protein
MGELREIVDIAAVSRLFTLLAVVGPIVGVAIGAAVGARRRNVRGGALAGMGFGLLLTLNGVLWQIYNLITDATGIDTVKNVVSNFALFVLVGLTLGAGIGLAQKRMKGGSA